MAETLSAGPAGIPTRACIYGQPPRALADVPDGALQVSPLIPNAHDLEALAPGSLDVAVIAAPPGTVERRWVLARVLQALSPDGDLTVMAPKEKGGARLRKELEAFGCAVNESGRQHQRICNVSRPIDLQEETIAAALTAGALQYSESQGLWTQPGVFSWDRLDPGTRQLMAVLPPLIGRGADLGCGLGGLAKAVLANEAVTHIDLLDLDRRAITAARRNVEDPRAAFHWADVRQVPLSGLDFVVMNPPFHDGGQEDRDLGQTFIRRAREILRPGGVLWLVANRHLPYEAVLNDAFARVRPANDGGGFKVVEARR